MAPARYEAEEVDPGTVADDLVRLWSANLGSMGARAATKLEWFYRAGPAGRGHALVLRAIGDRGARIVGCQGIGLRRVMCDGSTLTAALLADLAVDADHRGLFAALTLVRRTREVAAGASELQYGFPNQAAVGVFRRIGYHPLGAMARRVRVLRFERYVSRRFPRRPLLARLGGALLDATAAGGAAPRRLLASRRFRVAYLSGPDGRFDALFAEACRGHVVLADRGREFLRWRFFSRAPGAELATLVRRSDGALRGYAVVVRQGDVAHLADFLAVSDDELDALLALLPPTLRARGCASASARFLGAARIARVLERRGFRLRDADRVVVVDGGRSPLSDRLRDAESYYLTDADEDE